MYHIQKLSLVACILLVLLYVNCGGGGDGGTSSSGTNTFIVTDPSTGIQLLCGKQTQGGATSIGCASAGTSMNSGGMNPYIETTS